jgi:hypothetical protein
MNQRQDFFLDTLNSELAPLSRTAIRFRRANFLCLACKLKELCGLKETEPFGTGLVQSDSSLRLQKFSEVGNESILTEVKACLQIAFGNQTIFEKRFPSSQRLTALRPCLAAGLPLSCAIVILQKNSACFMSSARID